LDDLVSPDLPLPEELVVDGTGLVAVEAIFVRVIEPLQREVLAASRVGTIQKRAMMTQLHRWHQRCIGRVTDLA
jgi:hypothetical protein